MGKPVKPKRPQKTGRPANGSLDNPATAERLLGRIASGESIAEVCKDADMPAESTVYLRMAKDESFRSLIARAREAQQDFEADHCIKMADDATPEDWQVVKLRIWARQWRAGKLAPKKYGDKLELSGNKENPVAMKVDVTLSPAEAYARAIKPELA